LLRQRGCAGVDEGLFEVLRRQAGVALLGNCLVGAGRLDLRSLLRTLRRLLGAGDAT